MPDRTPPSFPPAGPFWQFLDEPVPCELPQVITGRSRVPAQITCEPSRGCGPLPVELLQDRLASSVRERLEGPDIGHLFRDGAIAFASHVRTVLVQRLMCNPAKSRPRMRIGAQKRAQKSLHKLVCTAMFA